MLNELGSLPLAFYSGFILERRYDLSNETLGAWLRDQAKSFGIGLLLAGRRCCPRLLADSPIAGSLVARGRLRVRCVDRGPDQPGAGAPAAAVLHGQAARRETASRLAADRPGRARRRAGARRVRVGTREQDEESECRAGRPGKHAADPGVGHDARRVQRRGNRGRPRPRARASRARRHLEGCRVRERADPGRVLSGVAVVECAGESPLACAASPTPRACRCCCSPRAACPWRWCRSPTPCRARFERSADRFALDLTRNPSAFISAMRRLGAQNLAEDQPSKIVQWLFYSHPPIKERIAAAQGFKS